MRAHDFEFGLDTFLPVTVDETGHPIPGDQVIRNAVEEAVLAESVGIDSFNIGEHYRPEFMDSANHVVLAAIAGRTERIRLGTAVTVLSTQDPVRLYTDFATLDAVSDGRAQLIVGRGSLTDSFPLFGFDLADYEDAVRGEARPADAAAARPAGHLVGRVPLPARPTSVVSPPIAEGHLPTWVGVGGSPQSVVRAARFGAAADARDHRRQARAVRARTSSSTTARSSSTDSRSCRSGCTRSASSPRPTRRRSRSSGRTTSEQFEWAARERGWREPTYEQFAAEVDHGSMYVGSPETVARRIAASIAHARR